MKPRTLRVAQAACGALVLAGLASVTGARADDQTAELALGKQVFTTLSNPRCAVCHTLKDAGAEGAIGPGLDELRPTAERVQAAVLSGVGIMPSYGGTLTDEQIAALARYVAHASRK